MNSERHKFEHEHEQRSEAAAHHQHSSEQSAMEFAQPEEALRFDAAQTAVPEKVEERLTRSMKREPQKETSWWRRMLGQ